jgi:hypothetical protein
MFKTAHLISDSRFQIPDSRFWLLDPDSGFSISDFRIQVKECSESGIWNLASEQR